MAQILVVDDEPKIRTILAIMLQAGGHTVQEAASGTAALACLEENGMDLVISDIRMDDLDGFSLLAAMKEKNLDCPLVFITAYATLESAVEALRLGAADYLVKPFSEHDVLLAVERALGFGRLLSENRLLKEQLHAGMAGRDPVFASPAMRRVRDLAVKVAAREATVLLTGESGTGKEVIARMIHTAGPRKNERFVAVNCAAISAGLIESELFGHEKGAFTGADRTRIGKFEFAGPGTLFLDEVGDLPLEAQAKLLRAIQEKSVERIGGNREIPVACRLVCATNKDLEKLVARGAFREDLFYRLAVFPIHIPPLRERREDIEPLVHHFVAIQGGRPGTRTGVITPAALRRLQEYPWPGNIRELANGVERAMIIKGGELPLTSDDFQFLKAPCGMREGDESCFSLPPAGIDFEALQRAIVRQALERTGGNQSAAARLLGLTRARFRTLNKMLHDA